MLLKRTKCIVKEQQAQNMSNGVICKYCDKRLINKNNLSQHYKTRYCIRHSDDRGDKVEIEYSCDYCHKTYSRSTNLQRHLSLCSKKEIYDVKDKYEKLTDSQKEKRKESKIKFNEEKNKNKSLIKQIKTLEKEVERQKGIIDGLKTAPDKKTIYNTAYVHPKLVNLPINNIRALTDEYVIERVNDGILTYEKAARGYPGMLEVICDLITHENDDGIVERNYVCTDVSRNSFHRLLASKKWRPDKGGRYLNSMLDTFRDVIEEHKNKVYDAYDDTLHDSFGWEQVDWERKNISKIYSGVVCNEGTEDREELINILRKEISKRASV